MKTIHKVLIILALLPVVILSCQKELSVEGGDINLSDGILQADITGTCTGTTIGGTYKKDTSLNASHYVDVTVLVNSAGGYTISTDTLNGYYFRATGSFAATGSQVVRLNGHGKPLVTGSNTFTVKYDSTECEFTVTVVGATGGSAVFTLNGAPGSCAGAIVSGSYVVGTALTSSNQAVLNVNVSAIGTWSITTTAVNGIVFSGSGTFTTTGPQTITLTGSGTPVAAGNFTVSVTIGSSTCTFTLTCTATAVIDYYPRTANSNWSYEYDGDPNDSLLRKVIPQTATIAGNTYAIFMATEATVFDSSGYYRKSGSDYFEWIDMGAYLGYDNSFWIEYNFLKDNLPQGGTWNSVQFTGPVTPQGGGAPVQITARFGYKIVQKDVAVIVKGVSYPNTIVVEEKLWIMNPATSTWEDVSAQTGYFIYSYSRNIGMIKQDYHDPTGVVFPLDLRRHQVL